MLNLVVDRSGHKYDVNFSNHTIDEQIIETNKQLR